MSLRTHKTNVGGIKLYEKNGFVKTCEEIFAEAYPLQYIAVNFEINFDDDSEWSWNYLKNKDTCGTFIFLSFA